MGIHLSGEMPISLPAGITIVQAQSDGGNPDGNGDNKSGFENGGSSGHVGKSGNGATGDCHCDSSREANDGKGK